MVAQSARLRIRPAGIADADAIADVWVASWRAAYRGVLPDAFLDDLSRARTLAYWLARLLTTEPGQSGDRVAELEGRVVGLAQWGHATSGEPGTAELFTLYVLPASWGTGVGRQLLEAVMREARAEAYDTMVLWVLQQNARARRFYRLAGFRPDGGRRPESLPGARVPSVRYRCRL